MPEQSPSKQSLSPQQRAAYQRRLVTYQERVTKPEIFQLDPLVRITLGGQVYLVEFDMRAAADVLKDCGFNLLSPSLLEAFESPDILGSMLHRGLQRHQEQITRADADRLFTLRHHPYITQILNEALALFNPDLSDVPLPDVEESPEDPHP